MAPEGARAGTENSSMKLFRPPQALVLLLASSLPLASLAQETPPSLPDALQPQPLEPGQTPLEAIPDADAPVATLEELLQRAERPDGNYNLEILRENLEQAHNQVLRAWSALLPVVNAGVGYTRNSHEAIIAFPNFSAGFRSTPDGNLIPNEIMNVTVQSLNQWNAFGQATVPILLAPAYYGISAANLGVEATEFSITFARNELILSIAQSYYGAVASRRLIEVAYFQVQAQREQEKVALARYELGEVAKVDYLRAAVARAQAEQDLVRAQNAFVSTKLALQRLTGLEERFDVVAPAPVVAPTGELDVLIRTGIESRKDLAASRTAVDIAERTLSSAWWQFAPVITANGNFFWQNVTGFTGSQTNWVATVNAVFTIFDGGLRYANLRDARSLLRQAEARKADLVRGVVQEVKTSLLNLESARANLIKARDQAGLADETARLVRLQYEAGAATYLDVTDALNARFAAQTAAVTEELNVQVASLQLSRAIGKFGVEHFPERN